MKKIIIANWGMGPKTYKEATKLFSEIEKGLLGADKKSIIVLCPPFPYLSAFQIKGIKLGSQNCFWEENKTTTGEVSCGMLLSLGVKYVIVGHSERRSLGETNEEINKKIKILLKNGMKVVLCVGESERDEFGIYLKIIESQLLEGLKNINSKHSGNLSIIYEPTHEREGAVSSGPHIEELREMFLFIKKILVGIFGREAGLSIPILYGGRVDKRNAEGLIVNGGADGLLVGKLSLDSKKFLEIISKV